MVQIKQILRLRSQCSLSLNEIARTLHLSKGVVAKYVKLAQLAGLIWDDAKHLDEAALHQKLRPKRQQNAVPITALDDGTDGHPNSVANVNVASATLATNAHRQLRKHRHIIRPHRLIQHRNLQCHLQPRQPRNPRSTPLILHGCIKSSNAKA